MSEKAGFEPVWLKDRKQARPIKEKIKVAMKDCPAMLQIWTKDLAGTPREFGSVKEEYAWYDEIRPDGSIALCVEAGIQLSGQIKYEVEPLPFDSAHLDQVAPEVVEYLLDLRRRVGTRTARQRSPSEVTVAILHGTESWGQCKFWYSEFSPDYWENWARSRGFNVTRVSVLELSKGETVYDAVINPFGEAYPERDTNDELTLVDIVAYIERGGTFVCTGGWPFYYAYGPGGRSDSRSRLKRTFSVDVNDEQLWRDIDPVAQPDGSVRKYGELAHKGGGFRVTVWRPVWESYGAVEKVLVSAKRNGILLGVLPRGKGRLVVTGMFLESDAEFEKLAALVEALLLRP